MTNTESSTGRACPDRIGRYRVESELGRGAMGVVYKGYDESIDRPVALKTIRADLLDNDDGIDWMQRFKQEARAAARCAHPNIVTVYEFGEDAGLTFIAMEYVRGRELQSFLAHGVDFGVRISLRMVMQVLSGLDSAHAVGIVHRDIKPSNVIILENGTVKVTDFGIARLDSVSLSRHGTMVGTPGYMAPEQFTGGAVDGRTDLFAVGVLLYEMLTGMKPFAGSTIAEVMYKVLNEAPAPPVGRSEALPPRLAQALTTALSRDPAQRFPDAAAFRNALKAVVSGLPVASNSSDATVVGGAGMAGSEDMEERTRVMSPAMAAATAKVQAIDRGELDAAALKQASDHLASYLGPVASLIVRDAAQRASGIRDLYDALSGHIQDDKQRSAFLRKVARGALGLPGHSTRPGTRTGEGTSPGTSPGTSHGSGVFAAGSGLRTGPLSDADTERARVALVNHLGPIASVLVRKAAANATSLQDLGTRLANHIADPDARAAFLAQLRG